MLRSWLLTRGAEFCLLLAFLIHDRLRYSDSALSAVAEAATLFLVYAGAVYLLLLYGPVSYLPYLIDRGERRGKALSLLGFALTPAWPILALLLTGFWSFSYLASREGGAFLVLLGMAIPINVLVPVLVLGFLSERRGSQREI